MCIGSTDVPLSVLGRLQGCVAGAYLQNQGFDAVYSSPLGRARDTAECICREYRIVENLREMDAGLWEGKTFRQIQQEFPELYARRGENMNLPIPEAEDSAAGAERFSGALEGILESAEGNVVVVTHITVLQSYLSRYLEIPANESRGIVIPHGSISLLEMSSSPELISIGEIPKIALTDDFCSELMKTAGAGDHVILHCRKVAETADTLAEELCRAGCTLNREKIHFAALLHDIARSYPNHGGTGGNWLKTLGYADEAELVFRHHDILPVEITEASVLSMADRCVFGTELVTVQERFTRSAEKCTGKPARQMHEARWENAKALQSLMNSICHSTVIE